MNLFDQASPIAYLDAVLVLAAVSMAVALAVVLDAVVRTWRSHTAHRGYPEAPGGPRVADSRPGQGGAQAQLLR